MEFDCISKSKSKTERWKGRIKSLYMYENFYDFWIESRSSIHVIVGKTTRGGFACMPDFGAGCHIADLNDEFWNKEKLVRVLGKVDGITVSGALTSIAKIIQEQS